MVGFHYKGEKRIRKNREQALKELEKKAKARTEKKEKKEAVKQ